MKYVNHKFFRKKFYKYINKTFDVVSTIDHPYVSPPVRLIDGHNNLKMLNDRGLSPLICIWDVNFPNANNYRYELALDTGILSLKDENFFIFSDKFLYPLQQPKLIDFQELKKRVRLVLENLHNLQNKSKIIRDAKFVKNFEKIADVYAETIKNSSDGTSFYQNLLKNIYNLTGLSDLANFTADFSQPYFAGPISQEWIPYCIQETKDEPYGLFNLLETGIFKKLYFRTTTYNNDEILFDKENINNILHLIKNKNLIPSYQIFFWTLFLADIKHFGNDYGFFDKLNKVIAGYSFQFPDNIQITKHNEDSNNIIQFEKDGNFSCSIKNDTYIIKKNNPVKNSRISSVPALYCHLGNDLNKIIIDIFEKKIKAPKIIKMGIVYG